MAKGHVTPHLPHFMLGRTAWQHGLSPQDMRNTRFSGFQRGPQGVPHQSPHGKKLLARHVPPSPYSAKVTPTFAGSAQAATVAAIPYYDLNTTVPFVARFGDAPARVGAAPAPVASPFASIKLSEKQRTVLAKIFPLIPAAIWVGTNLKVLDSIDVLPHVARDIPLSILGMAVANFLMMFSPLLLPKDFAESSPKETNSSDTFKVLTMSALSGFSAVTVNSEFPLLSSIMLLFQGVLTASLIHEMGKEVAQYLLNRPVTETADSRQIPIPKNTRP